MRYPVLSTYHWYLFNINHAMICKQVGFIIQRLNELRDLEAELLNIVCNDVQIEPQLQEIDGEVLTSGSNKAQDARLDVHRFPFGKGKDLHFLISGYLTQNAESYKELTPKQIYHMHENEKKRLYNRRVVEIEEGTFTPLVFTTTGGMGKECKRYHSRLAEMIALKKGELYSKVSPDMVWKLN